jgi:hypothetical protein
MLIRGAKNRVISVGLDVLLQILRTLERLSTKVTLVWLQWDVDTNVRSDVITLDRGGSARVPSAGEIQVVCALPADMLLTNVIEKGLSRRATL